MNWVIIILLFAVVVTCIYMTKTKESYTNEREREDYDTTLLPPEDVVEEIPNIPEHVEEPHYEEEILIPDEFAEQEPVHISTNNRKYENMGIEYY